LLRLPLVITQHGFTPRSRKQKFYTWLSLQLCRTASVNRVVCVAESIAVLHRQASVRAEKLQVIPNGLPAAAAMQPHLDRQRWLAGYVGRLSSEKGPDLFLDALIPLCHQHPQLDAVMLGDGPERDSLLARIIEAGLQERITSARLPDRHAAWWRQLDALVISSRTEGTPMILLEAMQAGVPVVAFGVGGIPDVLEDRHNGLLATPADSAALARQIGTLLREPNLARADATTQDARNWIATTSRPWPNAGRSFISAPHGRHARDFSALDRQSARLWSASVCWPALIRFWRRERCLGLVGFAVLYRKPTWGLLGIAALVPFEGFFKDSSLVRQQADWCLAGGDPDAATGAAPDSVRAPAQQHLALPDRVHGCVFSEPAQHR
jgi:glycosyltransferase involved in cell wall biosynthesis